MGKLNLSETIKKPAQRSAKVVTTAAGERSKSLTVKFTPDEYKALRLYALENDSTHQDVIHDAVMRLVGM